ncbi:MAG: bifunctional 3-deoxy-7-phosphoheptulonate synthase/chorismate mutase type II [Flammeovirgaceae bacterium]|nr:bifunctional 3-deoxy-7-phosphoheptulonate synthase/chorismate mutase type II [Flammeovirgaceae bacterium]
MNIADSLSWIKTKKRPFIIAGPCSAESPEQLQAVARQLVEMGVHIMRAGVWKPRTRPDTFEGKGHEALQWLKKIKNEFDIRLACEVASPFHVEQALEADMDILWLGARTTVNPFLVQEIAESLRGVDMPILVKNPINPDLALWIGALERINRAGISKLGAVHRGFSSYQKSQFRNLPTWWLPLELKTKYPDLPLICDPSHISGNRSMVPEVSQKAMDLGYDGLMIEVHPDPKNALSDADQQINPDTLLQLITNLKITDKQSSDVLFINQLEQFREKIDHLDQELIEVISARMKLAENIGLYKKDNNVTIFQLERWNEIMKTRPEWGMMRSLSEEFIKDLYTRIHDESIRIQTDIRNTIGEIKK